MIFKRLKKFFHRFERNILFLSEMMFLNKSQSTMSSLCSNVFVQFETIQINFSEIVVTRLLNLHITNIMTFMSIWNISSAKMKSITIAWNDTNNVNIDWKLLYNLWPLIWFKLHLKQCLMYDLTCLINF